MDLTHVIAGPTCAKTLASFGAEVLHIFCPTRARLAPFDIDTGHGKLQALLDLKKPADNHVARELLKQADVFSQSYRPGKLTSLGFSPHGLAEARPGIIVTSTSCYGHEGPGHFRPGFEQLAQSATGMAVAQGAIDSPQLAPTFPNDYLTGFLGALGTLAALVRRSEEGGSYHVKVSLARSGTWLQSLGRLDRGAYDPQALTPAYIKRYMAAKPARSACWNISVSRCRCRKPSHTSPCRRRRSARISRSGRPGRTPRKPPRWPRPKRWPKPPDPIIPANSARGRGWPSTAHL